MRIETVIGLKSTTCVSQSDGGAQAENETQSRFSSAIFDSGETGVDAAISDMQPRSNVQHQQSSVDHCDRENQMIHVDSADAANREVTPSKSLQHQQSIADQSHSEIQGSCVGRDASDDGALSASESQEASSPVIARIQQLWRMRQRWHRAEKSLTLQGKAVCRAWTNGDKDEASKLFDRAQKGDVEIDPTLRMALEPFLRGIEQFEPMRTAIEKELRKAGRQLPAWEWAGAVRGFGDLNFAALVGECGDIGTYRNPSCVWKRMGLGVINGERQRRKTNADEAALHGYNPSRRAVAYLLGDTLVKGNRDGTYRAVYLKRKADRLAANPEMRPLHAHRDAQRYMEKRVLKDLWVAWRQANRLMSTNRIQPDADLSHGEAA